MPITVSESLRKHQYFHGVETPQMFWFMRINGESISLPDTFHITSISLIMCIETNEQHTILPSLFI